MAEEVIHRTVVEPSINVKLEKNSRGMNYEITVVGAKDVETALALIDQGITKLADAYGTQE